MNLDDTVRMHERGGKVFRHRLDLTTEDLLWAAWYVENNISEDDIAVGGRANIRLQLVCDQLAGEYEPPEFVQRYYEMRRLWVDANGGVNVEGDGHEPRERTMGAASNVNKKACLATERVWQATEALASSSTAKEFVALADKPGFGWVPKAAADAFRAKCHRHDLAYEYSDDPSVYRSGSESYRHLTMIAGILGDLVDCGQIFAEVAESKVKFPGMFSFSQPAGNGGAV